MWQFLVYLLVVVLLVVAVLAYYLLVRQRVLAPYTVRAFTLEPGTLLYTTYRGDYKALMPTVDAVKADLCKFLLHSDDKQKRTSADLTMCGIYYDPPHALVDVTQGRALLGVVIRDEDEFSVQAFLKMKDKACSYQIVSLGRLQAFGAEFPLLGFPSLMSAVIRGYPAIREWAATSSNGLLERTLCSMETYQWAQKSMGICFLYGKNAEALVGLSKYPQPQLKASCGPVKVIKKMR